MKINIRGIKVKTTSAINTHIENKISKLNKYFINPEEITASVIVRIRNLEQIVEVTIPTSRYTLRAEESHSDLYAAIDLVIDKLESQIRKNKSKISSRVKTYPDIAMNLDFEESEEVNAKIVKRKNIDSKPMSEEEAILQMSLLNHDFFLFKNINEECYSVIYLRRDGQYGIINAK